MPRRAWKESEQKANPSSIADEEKPLWEHLAELKRYLFVSLAAVLAGAGAIHTFHDRIIAHLLRPLGGEELVFLKPTDALFFILKLDFFGGLLLAFPIILWCVLRFLSPALGRARRKVWLFLSVALLLGAGSLAYAYLVLLPIVLEFLLGITVEGVEPTISAQSYLSFIIIQGLLAIGIFQVPLVLILLSALGLVNPATIRARRRETYLAMMVTLAVLTPTTDLVTLALVLVPTVALFEAGLLVSAVLCKS